MIVDQCIRMAWEINLKYVLMLEYFKYLDTIVRLNSCFLDCFRFGRGRLATLSFEGRRFASFSFGRCRFASFSFGRSRFASFSFSRSRLAFFLVLADFFLPIVVFLLA